jgi:succinylglutamate desuccinylase
MRYDVRDSLHVQLHTMIRGNSVHAELVRIPRHFQLAERQFHWISEYNR